MTAKAIKLLLVFCCTVTVAFIPSTSRRQQVELRVSWWDQDEESYRQAHANNIARTDVQNFLTQRSLQSFVHLLHTCRDPHTVKWLEDFGGWSNLMEYHGLGALNNTRFPSWDTVLLDMMQEPEDVVIVSAKRRGRGHGGWSQNNPYLPERFVEFKIDIDPTSLASRIISVREQLAGEWVEDLETLKSANDQILDSYREKIQMERDLTEDEQEEQYSHFQRGDKHDAFDRIGSYLLRNTMATKSMDSSPLRKSTFDLLLLMATQESIHRVLRDYADAGEKRSVSFEWFRDYYTERARRNFDGSQEYGRADDFLEELMLTPPSAVTKGLKMELIDPMRIAEEILDKRSDVLTEWKGKVSNASDDHMMLRKELLDKQMSKWGQPTSPSSSLKKESLEASPKKKSVGDFQ